MHGHDHHNQSPSGGRVLAFALSLTLVFAVVEFVAGWWAGSLALMADAGHMLTDSTALGLAAVAAWIAARPANRRRTWGLGRAEILAALLNGSVMLVLVGLIAWQAVLRFQDPPEVKGLAVLGVAFIGLLINLAVFRILHGGSRSLNVRGAMLHVLGDLLGSVAAIVSGGVIWLTGWTPIDPVLSLFICVLILMAAVRLLREALQVVMEGVPVGLDLEKVRTSLSGIEGVTGVHDLHIWQVSSERVALSAHVVVDEMAAWPGILAEAHRRLVENYGIDHPTLQPEPAEGGDCTLHPEACR